MSVSTLPARRDRDPRTPDDGEAAPSLAGRIILAVVALVALAALEPRLLSAPALSGAGVLWSGVRALAIAVSPWALL